MTMRGRLVLWVVAAVSLALAGCGEKAQTLDTSGAKKSDAKAWEGVAAGNQYTADGYKAGQQEHNMAMRPGTAAVALAPRPADLIGRKAADLDRAMKSLGYTRVAGLGKNRTKYSIWRGRVAGQCVSVLVRDGAVNEVGDIEDSNCR